MARRGWKVVVDEPGWRIHDRRKRYGHYELDVEITRRDFVTYDVRMLIEIQFGSDPALRTITFSEASSDSPITPNGLRDIKLRPLVEGSIGLWQDNREVDLILDEPAPDEPAGRMLSAVLAYRRHKAAGSRQPTKDAAAELHLSRPYIGRLLVEARRQGLLEPVNRGERQ